MPKPVPVPDAVTKPFWDAADQKKLVAQRCDKGHFQHPPAKECSVCKSTKLEFVPLSGKGKIFSYCYINDTRVQALAPLQPFPLVVVALDESPNGLFMTTNLTGDVPKQIKIGSPVQVDFEEIVPGRRLPQFKIVGAK